MLSDLAVPLTQVVAVFIGADLAVWLFREIRS